MKHFEFVPGDEIIIAPGRTVKRIRALVDIPDFGVKVGDLGGYIEKPENLMDTAWVSENARVFSNACVSGNARVSSNAWVSSNACVSGNGNVSGNAWVSNNACVSGNGNVYGNAKVYGNASIQSDADCIQIGPAKSSKRFTTAHVDEKLGVRVNCGCFSGSLIEFSQRIEKTHADNPVFLNQYRAVVQFIIATFPDQTD